MPKLICPKCGSTDDVPDAYIGREIRCHQCGAHFDSGKAEHYREPEPPIVLGSGSALRASFRCPFCGCQELPRHTRRVSTGGWIMLVCAILVGIFVPMPIGCFGGFIILLIAACITETVSRCRVCGVKLG